VRWAAVFLALVVVAACQASTPIETATPWSATGATIPELIAALNDTDADVRLEAVQALATRGDSSSVPALAEATSDAHPDVALAAIGALADIGGPGAVDAVLAIAATVPQSDDFAAADRFVAAVEALGNLRGPDAIARLLELKVDEDMDVAAGWLAAHDALEALGTEDIQALASALSHPDQAVRLEAITRLGKIGGPAAAKALLGQVGSKIEAIRMAAIEALGEAGDTSATATLVKALADDKVFAAASAALVKIYSHGAAPLVKYLKSKSTVGVYWALIRIGQKGTEAALVTALQKYGDKEMAVDYLNCGNASLEKAARTWASKHGYTVVTLPGGASVTWGGG
jgi:HEAT repeat protein